METINTLVGIVSLIVNIIMLFKVNDIVKNTSKVDGNNNKTATQTVSGKNNQTDIKQ